MERTLLAVYAHPDDEAFASGGTLARYASEGVSVRLVCATRGESGKVTDPTLGPVEDVGALREEELRRSCRELGLPEPVILGFHDSGRAERTRMDDPKALRNVDELELEAAVLEQVGAFRPDVMLTFDPHGIYGHVDHVRIHRAATGAFWAAGKVTDRPPRRLFYNVLSSVELRLMQGARPSSPLAELDPELYGVSEDSFAAVLDVSRWRDAKEAAVRAHRSQVGPASSFASLPQEAWELLFAVERFTLGGLRGGYPEAPTDDLFAGLA